MKNSRHMIVKLYNRRGYLGECGVSALEMALILPLILLIVFGIIDFGRLYSARVVLTNLAREGGSLASRDIDPNPPPPPPNLITMLQDGASPLNLANSGQIYITKIRAGTSKNNPNPTIDSASAHGGALSVQSSIGRTCSTLVCRPICINI